MNTLLDAFWFFLPAGLANMSPVLAARLPLLRAWNTPIHKPSLGDHKTWRGLISGIISGALTAALLHSLLAGGLWGRTTAAALLAGAALGAGALIGDAVKSYFKRKAGVKPGYSWFPFDQTDYIFGGLLFVSPLVSMNPELIAAVFGLYFGLHLLVSYAGYLVGLKDKPI